MFKIFKIVQLFLKIRKYLIFADSEYPKIILEFKKKKKMHLHMNRKNQSKIRSVKKLGKAKCPKPRNLN